MDLQQLLSVTRKAVDEYRLIDQGDTIAIGLSGGKDSMAMLYALSALRNFYPKQFDLKAITVDLGFENKNSREILQSFCNSMDVPFHFVETNIGHVVFEDRKEKNPCALCAKLRKGALNRNALLLGCNKIAYAHHRDDLIETFLMSLIFEGRIHTFSPYTYLSRTGLTVIRPMMFLEENDIVNFKNHYHLPVISNPCPENGNSRREWAKEKIRQLDSENPGTRQNLFAAVINGQLDGWPERICRKRQ